MIEHYTPYEHVMPLPADISRDDMHQLVIDMMSGRIDEHVMHEKLTTHTPEKLNSEQLAGCVDGIVESATFHINSDVFNTPLVVPVGTGGDRQSTVNITTMAGFVMAGSGECKVALYGNKKASGKFGKMDVLESVGVNIDVSEDEIYEELNTSGIAPINARTVYPNAKNIAGVRNNISRSTIFNIAFPLAAPVVGKNARMFIGSADPNSMHAMAEISAARGTKKSIFVHGLTNSLDEVSMGSNYFVFQDNNAINSTITDLDGKYRSKNFSFNHLQADTPEEFVSLFLRTLDPKEDDTQLRSIRSIVAINAAVGLYLASSNANSLENTLPEYFEHTMEILSSGRAKKTLGRLIT